MKLVEDVDRNFEKKILETAKLDELITLNKQIAFSWNLFRLIFLEMHKSDVTCLRKQ